MNASSLYETYLRSYTPEAFMDFYASMEEELHLRANPARAIPFSQAPLLLDGGFEARFEELVSLLWGMLANETYRELCAESIPPPLRPPAGVPFSAIPFEPANNIGCIDFHLEGSRIRIVEFMVLPPGMVGIYPAMLTRYGGYLENVVTGYRPTCFRQGWDRARCEQVALEHVLRGREPERVAIIDWEPERQITYGEFRYTLELIHGRTGIPGLVADPREVTLEGSRIRVRGEPVDRILNRLTLVEWNEHHASIEAYTRLLWEAPEVFVYHPYAWFLGDKLSLTRLSDPAALERMGLPEDERTRLRDLLPTTRSLSAFCPPGGGAVDEERLLEVFGASHRLVLKPASSHASKGILFGPVDMPTPDRLRDVLARIDPEAYVAMEYVAPPQIQAPRGQGVTETWKCDYRIFTLNSTYVFPGGRIYFGDYTNQTPCRGFAPLFFV